MENKSINLKELASFLKEIILESGKITMATWGRVDDSEIIYKKPGLKAPVTPTDKKVSEYLTSEILKKYPGFTVVSEEAETIIPTDGQPLFIIDPIDGTRNFIKGDINFGITVAFALENKIQVGAIFFPATNEYFESILGSGVYLNGSPVIKVGNPTSCYAYWPEEKDGALKTFDCTSAPTLKCVTREMVNIAIGLSKGGFYLKVFPWDYAAGALMVNEMGGKVTDELGNIYKITDTAIIVYSNGK